MDLRSRIPSGPEDAPVLLTRGSALEFDVDDVDGRLFMLDRDFGGTATAAFSKPMDPSVAGVVHRFFVRAPTRPSPVVPRRKRMIPRAMAAMIRHLNYFGRNRLPAPMPRRGQP